MLLFFYFILLHQQNLCAKSILLNETLKEVVGELNLIQANAKRHRHVNVG